MTDDELQVELGMNPSTERPRRIELMQQNRVCDSGLRRKTRTGRMAVVWQPHSVENCTCGSVVRQDERDVDAAAQGSDQPSDAEMYKAACEMVDIVEERVKAGRACSPELVKVCVWLINKSRSGGKAP